MHAYMQAYFNSFLKLFTARYVAFEDGLDNGTMHVPGCCNNYVHLDMAPYFAWSPSQQRQQQQQ